LGWHWLNDMLLRGNTWVSMQANYCILRLMSHMQFLSCDSVTRGRDSRRCCHCRVACCDFVTKNKHGFSTIFPISPSSFTNTVPKWWNCSISNLFWTLRLIICFRFTRQPTKTKLLPRISSVWSVYATVTACNCTVARCDFIARQNHAIKLQVWHRSKTHSPVNIYMHRHEMNELLQISIL